MEEEYEWELISKVAVPFSLIEAYIFYTNLGDAWKWVSLVAALALTGMIIYMYDKKKSNMFTAIAIVFLIALIIRLLKNSRLI